jgi:hypothetical protein
VSAAQAIRDFIAPVLGADWVIQYGAFDERDRSQACAVIKPIGGGKAELIRTPLFSLYLIGFDGQSATDVEAKANQIIEAMRASSGNLVSMQPGEPVFMPTADRRAVFEIAVSAITV